MQHLDEGTVHSWLDGALPPDEAARAEAHVASCAACAALVAEARGFIAAASRILTALDDVPGQVLPSAPPARPPSASDAGVVPIASRRARWWRVTPNHLRVAAAIAFIAGTSVLVTRIDEGTVGPASDYSVVTAAETPVSSDASANTAVTQREDAAPPGVARATPASPSEVAVAKSAEPVRTRRGPFQPLPRISRDGATAAAGAAAREEDLAQKVPTAEAMSAQRSAGVTEREQARQKDAGGVRAVSPPAAASSASLSERVDATVGRAAPAAPPAGEVLRRSADQKILAGAATAGRPSDTRSNVAAGAAGAAASFAAPACFDLAFTDWTRLSDKARAATRRLPARVMLDSAVVGGPSRGLQRVRATAPSLAGGFTDGEWSANANELLLEWNVDEIRVSAWLAVSSEGVWRGDVEVSGTESPLAVTGAVTARRIACTTR